MSLCLTVVNVHVSSVIFLSIADDKMAHVSSTGAWRVVIAFTTDSIRLVGRTSVWPVSEFGAKSGNVDTLHHIDERW